MSFKRSSLPFLIIYLMLATQVEAKEILQPLDGIEIDAIMEKHCYEIKETTYFAKNYRIVKVDTKYLIESEPGATFDIPLFDGNNLTIAKSSADHPYPHSWNWKGLIQDVYLSQRITQEGLPPQLEQMGIERFKRMMMGVDLFIMNWDLIRETNEPSFVGNRLDENSDLVIPPNQYQQPVSGLILDAFQSVLGHITHRTPDGLVTEYSLSPVDNDPRFHLFIERDPAKVIVMGDGNYDSADTFSAEMKKRQNDYENYRDALKQECSPNVRPGW